MRKLSYYEEKDLAFVLGLGPYQARGFGLLTPQPKPEERWTRQQRRADERRVAKDHFRSSYRKGLI